MLKPTSPIKKDLGRRGLNVEVLWILRVSAQRLFCCQMPSVTLSVERQQQKRLWLEGYQTAPSNSIVSTWAIEGLLHPNFGL